RADDSPPGGSRPPTTRKSVAVAWCVPASYGSVSQRAEPVTTVLHFSSIVGKAGEMKQFARGGASWAGSGVRCADLAAMTAEIFAEPFQRFPSAVGDVRVVGIGQII